MASPRGSPDAAPAEQDLAAAGESPAQPPAADAAPADHLDVETTGALEDASGQEAAPATSPQAEAAAQDEEPREAEPAAAAAASPPPQLPAGKPRGEGVDEALCQPKVEVMNSTELGADSTCAASTMSVASLSDQRLAPLLKVSPPMPVGRVAGRYMVRLWRASAAMPYGMAFAAGERSSIIVAEEAPHLGIRKGDELLSINGKPVESVRKCGEMLAANRDLELLLYHREVPHGAGGEVRVICGSTSMEPYDIPMCCDACFSPPEPRCRARTFPLRDVLLSTGPVPAEHGTPGLFSIQIVRMSRKQTFGLAFSPTALAGESMVAVAMMSATSSTDRLGNPQVHAPRRMPPPASEDEQRALLGDDGRSLDTDSVALSVVPSVGLTGALTVGVEDAVQPSPLASDRSITPTCSMELLPGEVLTVSRDLPHLGLQEGDQLLRVNGTPIRSLDACKAMLKGSMTITLELIRPGGVFKGRTSESTASSCQSKDVHIVPGRVTGRCDGSSAVSGLLQWLGVRLCCMGNDTGVIDERTGADWSCDYEIAGNTRRGSLDVSAADVVPGGYEPQPA